MEDVKAQSRSRGSASSSHVDAALPTPRQGADEGEGPEMDVDTEKWKRFVKKHNLEIKDGKWKRK
eukprot:7631916-Karenia_brevis.AAC.1